MPLFRYFAYCHAAPCRSQPLDYYTPPLSLIFAASRLRFDDSTPAACRFFFAITPIYATYVTLSMLPLLGHGCCRCGVICRYCCRCQRYVAIDIIELRRCLMMPPPLLRYFRRCLRFSSPPLMLITPPSFFFFFHAATDTRHASISCRCLRHAFFRLRQLRCRCCFRRHIFCSPFSRAQRFKERVRERRSARCGALFAKSASRYGVMMLTLLLMLQERAWRSEHRSSSYHHRTRYRTCHAAFACY